MIFELSPKFHKLINKLKLCILFNLIFYYLSDNNDYISKLKYLLSSFYTNNL